jgi:hypothetical protein
MKRRPRHLRPWQVWTRMMWMERIDPAAFERAAGTPIPAFPHLQRAEMGEGGGRGVLVSYEKKSGNEAGPPSRPFPISKKQRWGKEAGRGAFVSFL